MLEQIEQYWTNRAEGYSEVNKAELIGCQHHNWKKYIGERIRKTFPNRKSDTIRILDIGAGPGFLSIILAEEGYHVTAADYTQAMLECAVKNAGMLAEKINFVRADANELPFEENSFDVVLSRNLTWNLENPEKAYSSWCKVLKPGGLMLVFDANWYSYLLDEEKKTAYTLDRENVAKNGYEDYNIGDNFDVMERIAEKMPLTPIKRPDWDVETLKKLNMLEISAEENVGEQLYSELEKVNFASTPMFCIQAVKG